MMRPQDKVPALGIVWGVFLVLAFVTLLHSPLGFWDAALGIVMVLATFGATGFILTGAEPKSHGDTQSQGKAKHSDLALVERLMESMSDEELAALKKRLSTQQATIGDDGELITKDYHSTTR